MEGQVLGRPSAHTHPDLDQVMAHAQKEDLCRINVDAPVSLRKEFRVRAASDERSIRSILIEAIVTHLNK